MANSSNTNNPQDILITNVPAKVATEITNIADNIGIPRASFLKQELRRITESYPADMKVTKDSKK